jgi:hypothetical protein
MTTRGTVSLSRSSNARPRAIEIPMASKYPCEMEIFSGETSDSPGFIWYPSARMTLSLWSSPSGTDSVEPA